MRWVFIGLGIIAFLVLGRFALGFVNPPDIELSDIQANRVEWRNDILSCTAEEVNQVRLSDPVEAALEGNLDRTDIPVELTARADQGDTDAIAAVAVLNWILETGVDDSESFNALRQAMMDGSVYARREYGRAFIEGDFNVEPDTTTARRYLSQAMNAGDSTAAYLMSELYLYHNLEASGRDPRTRQQIVWDLWLQSGAECYFEALSAIENSSNDPADADYYDAELSSHIQAILSESRWN